MNAPMRKRLGFAVLVAAVCFAAPATADAQRPETLYLYVHGGRSVSVVWSIANGARVSIEIDCKGRRWYMPNGPLVIHANNFRLRYRGRIRGVRGAREGKDGKTHVVPAPPAARLRMRGYWPTPRRARMFVRHSVCFPDGKRLTLRSQALGRLGL